MQTTVVALSARPTQTRCDLIAALSAVSAGAGAARHIINGGRSLFGHSLEVSIADGVANADQHWLLLKMPFISKESKGNFQTRDRKSGFYLLFQQIK